MQQFLYKTIADVATDCCCNLAATSAEVCRDGHGDVAHDKASRYQQLLSYPQQYLRAVRLVAVRIDCQLPSDVPTQIGIDYRALVERKVFIGATTFVFLRRAVAFVKR